jgi:hypothetical protein
MANPQPASAGVRPQLLPQAILAHPRFAAARRAYVEAALALYENDPFLNRLLIEAARQFVFLILMCLDAACDEDDPASWPTMRLLLATMAKFGVASPRSIHSIVQRLISTGFFESRQVAADRRVRILVPTARMLEHDLAWNAAHYVPLAVMFPEADYSLPLGHDPAFHKAQRLAATVNFAYTAGQLAANPEVMLFLRHEGGIMLLMKLVQLAGERPEAWVAPISYSDLGHRFGVSRTHVRRVLEEAAARGLVQLSRRGVVLTPTLIDAFDRLVAHTISVQDMTWRMAMQSLGLQHADNASSG